ncbi:Clp protease N-terminal domain-containing protein [Streptomyces sp. NPDC048297]|uniref:Clp protease N-terminal domain-containing protein n=1 Tax=Streptomyces sp. NPDC048297 TaxID=3365531 RepID=UPI003717C84C
MQPRIAHQPAPDEGGPRADGRADDAAGLSAELAAVVAGARRRAVRDGDRQIDTAHLLHSLLEADPQARAAVGTSAQLARLLGYLVQRSIGYGLRWQSGVEDFGAGAVAVVPRPARHGGESKNAGGWSPVAAASMEDARRRARHRGEHQATGTDLLAALVVDPRSRAVEVLERAGISASSLRTRTESGAGSRPGSGVGCESGAGSGTESGAGMGELADDGATC